MENASRRSRSPLGVSVRIWKFIMAFTHAHWLERDAVARTRVRLTTPSVKARGHLTRPVMD